MRIKKVSQTTSTQAQVVNGYSTSTTDSYSANYVNGINTYSTDETVCGTWLGKPLYRKVFSGNLGQTSSLSHGISNINVITKINGAYKNTDSGTQFAIPSVRPNFPNFEVGIYVTTTEIVFDKGAGVTGDMLVFNLTLEYTKTTD